MSAGIMLPTTWPETDGHITLFYLGDDTNTMNRKAITDALDPLYIPDYSLRRVHGTEVEMFGPNNDIPVLRIEDEWVYGLQAQIAGLFKLAGIESGSEFTEFKPHVTFSLEPGVTIPNVLLAGRPQLWWDNVHTDLQPSI